MSAKKSSNALNKNKFKEKPARKPMPVQVTNRGWMQDISLEVIIPGHHTFTPGERNMELSANLMSEPLQHQGAFLYSLVVIVHVKIQASIISLLETRYSKVIDKAQPSQSDQSIAEQLYQEARPHLELLLSMSGHNPPLPQSLEQ